MVTLVTIENIYYIITSVDLIMVTVVTFIIFPFLTILLFLVNVVTLVTFIQLDLGEDTEVRDIVDIRIWSRWGNNFCFLDLSVFLLVGAYYQT